MRGIERERDVSERETQREKGREEALIIYK